MIQFRPGPDAGRYLVAAEGRPVAFPFNLRWLLPRLCGTSLVRWWVVWGASWPLLAAGVAWWASGWGVSWQVAVAAAALVVSLPGVLQPPSVWPVGVDLPAMAVSAWSAACFVHGLPVAGLLLAVLAVAIKEQTPVWIAVWAWSWLPLVVLPLVGVAYLIRRPQVDPITATPLLKRVHPSRRAWPPPSSSTAESVASLPWSVSAQPSGRPSVTASKLPFTTMFAACSWAEQDSVASNSRAIAPGRVDIRPPHSNMMAHISSPSTAGAGGRQP